MIETTNTVSAAVRAAAETAPYQTGFFHNIGSGGPTAALMWLLLSIVLVFGVRAAARRRFSGFYWAAAHVHFLIFAYSIVWAGAFPACLCLTPWYHYPYTFLPLTIKCFFVESASLLVMGLIVNLRAVRCPRFAWLPLISCILLTLDCVAIWAMKIGIFKLIME
jgi:hypothetical protein